MDPLLLNKMIKKPPIVLETFVIEEPWSQVGLIDGSCLINLLLSYNLTYKVFLMKVQ